MSSPRDQSDRALAARRELGRLRAERAQGGGAERWLHGRTLRRRATCPWNGTIIAIAALTQLERSEAIAATLAAVRARGLEEGKLAHAEPAMAEEMVQILARALRDPDTDELAYASAEDLARRATEDEIAWLFGEYSQHRQAISPMADELGDDDWARFEEAVKKKQPETWSAIASEWPRSWLLTTVERLAISLSSSWPSTPSDGESPTPAAPDQSASTETTSNVE